jgi:hypothetical protein
MIAAMQEPRSSWNGPGCGERELMRAVLEDAIYCLAGEVGPSRERPQLAGEARTWIVDSDARWPFSFDNICDALGIEAGGLRSKLLRDAPEIPLVEGGDVQPRRPRRERPAEDDIMQMIRAGKPLRVVAEAFGISISKVSILSCGLASRMKAERDEEIRDLRRDGWTHRALAARFGLSRIRILRICARREMPEEDRTAA